MQFLAWLAYIVPGLWWPSLPLPLMMAACAVPYTWAMAETTEGINKGGRPPNVPEVSPEEIVKTALAPRGRHHLSKETGISDKDAKIIKRVTGMTVEEFQEAQREELQEAMRIALSQTKVMLPKASALQAATVYGILDDKHGRPKTGNQTLHIHLAPGDRSGAIDALLGKHSERVLPKGESVSTRAGPASTGPVIDAELANPSPVSQSGDS